MALFGKSKKNTEVKERAPRAAAAKPSKPEKTEKKATLPAVIVAGKNASHVLRNPRITEKATLISERANVYVFDVAPSATKKAVSDAVKHYYKIEPIRVNIVMIPSKRVIVRGKRGVKRGGKKAYVYLAKGQTIEVL